MTCSSNDLPGSLKTSPRSVNTTGPLVAMLTTRNSMLSTPGAPGRMNAAIVFAIASLPVTGASGILWYTASSVKNAASSATPTLSDHAAQNLRTNSIGFSIWPPPVVDLAGPPPCTHQRQPRGTDVPRYVAANDRGAPGLLRLDRAPIRPQHCITRVCRQRQPSPGATYLRMLSSTW